MSAIERVYGLVNERLSEQFASIGRIDAKAGMLVGFNGLILSIILANHPSSSVRVIGGVVSLFASLGLLSVALRVTGFRTVDPASVCKYYDDHLANRSPEEAETDPLLAQVTRDASDSYEYNDTVLARKGGFINCGLWFLISGLVLLASAALRIP